MTAFDTLMGVVSASGPAPRRYPLVTGADGHIHYGLWRISYDPPPIPSRNCDWHWQHDYFDGAEDSNDRRAGSCASFADALNECDEYEDENS